MANKSQYTDMLVDVGKVNPDLWRYAFAANGASATLSGYFVGIGGDYCGTLKTFTITTATTFITLLGGLGGNGGINPIPTDNQGQTAVGFEGALSVSPIYYTKGGNSDGSITTGQSPAAGCAQISVGGNIGIGRV